MPVKIDITEQKYDFIDGATGEKLSAEDFAKKYPAVGLGGNTTNPATQQNEGGSEETK